MVASFTPGLVGLVVCAGSGCMVASDCDVAAETDSGGIWRPVACPVSSARSQVNDANGIA